MNSAVFGIDLGTTNSCITYYRDGSIHNIEDRNEGNRTIPSFVYFFKEEVISGPIAQKQALRQRAECGVCDFKRLIGKKFDNASIQQNKKYLSYNIIADENNEPIISIKHGSDKIILKTPVEICTIFLEYLHACAKDKLGNDSDQCVITVPAYFNVSQREATLKAASDAGLKVLKLLNEPTAAALNYLFQTKSADLGYYMVYDLGGGTFDISVLRKNEDKIDIIAVDGDTNLGGRDFDNLIMEHVCNVIKSKHNIDVTSDARTMLRVKKEAENEKRTLSQAKETTFYLDSIATNINFDMKLTTTEFEEMINDLLDNTIRIVDTCLTSCGLSKSDIRLVILSGGSTRIPLVGEKIKDYFGRGRELILNKSNNVDECVAEGAALQAAMLSQNPKQKIEQLKIVDVVSLSIGVGLACDEMDFLIKRNTPIPVSYSKKYSTTFDNQSSLSIVVYEGERLDATKNRRLGTFQITNLTPAPPENCLVEITFTIDINGILVVYAQEVGTDNVRELKINYVMGSMRSEGEVKNSLKDAEENKIEDQRFRTMANIRQGSISFCEAVIWNLNEMKLTEQHQDIYDECQQVKSKALSEREDEDLILQNCDCIVGKCRSLIKRYRFKDVSFVFKRFNINY